MMTTPAKREDAKALPLEFWKAEVARIGATTKFRSGLEVTDPEKAAKALFMSAQGVKQDDICAELGITRILFWRLNRQFYDLLRKRSPRGGKMKHLLMMPPKPQRENDDPRALAARIRQLGALIPHTKAGTYENERPEIIVDAAIRLGKRLIFHFE